MNYYNEFDPKAAAWLRQLIADGLIPPGDVDDRSIKDVKPDDLKQYTQCHFFAGIGGWSRAIELAGWPADRPIWTGSCPCQPYSVAGKGEGHRDERDLWPDFLALIREGRPEIVLGEQVASTEVVGTQLEAAFVDAVQGGDYARANKLAKRVAQSSSTHYHPRWITRVRTGLEAANYAVRWTVLGAHSAGAPHIRQRLFWGAWRVADNRSGGRQMEVQHPGGGCSQVQQREADFLGSLRSPVRLADMPRGGLGIDRSASRRAGHADERSEAGGVEHSGGAGSSPVREAHERADGPDESAGTGAPRGVGNASVTGLERHAGHGRDGDEPGRVDPRAAGSVATASAARGFWSAFDLIPCRDGKARRVEPGTFPLAHGVPARVVRLRGYGNAIVPQVAAQFVQAFEEACEGLSL